MSMGYSGLGPLATADFPGLQSAEDKRRFDAIYWLGIYNGAMTPLRTSPGVRQQILFSNPTLVTPPLHPNASEIWDVPTSTFTPPLAWDSYTFRMTIDIYPNSSNQTALIELGIANNGPIFLTRQVSLGGAGQRTISDTTSVIYATPDFVAQGGQAYITTSGNASYQNTQAVITKIYSS